eukprot:273740-Rhodomonas_salina.1
MIASVSEGLGRGTGGSAGDSDSDSVTTHRGWSVSESRSTGRCGVSGPSRTQADRASVDRDSVYHQQASQRPSDDHDSESESPPPTHRDTPGLIAGSEC